MTDSPNSQEEDGETQESKEEYKGFESAQTMMEYLGTVANTPEAVAAFLDATAEVRTCCRCRASLSASGWWRCDPLSDSNVCSKCYVVAAGTLSQVHAFGLPTDIGAIVADYLVPRWMRLTCCGASLASSVDARTPVAINSSKLGGTKRSRKRKRQNMRQRERAAQGGGVGSNSPVEAPGTTNSCDEPVQCEPMHHATIGHMYRSRGGPSTRYLCRAHAALLPAERLDAEFARVPPPAWYRADEALVRDSSLFASSGGLWNDSHILWAARPCASAHLQLPPELGEREVGRALRLTHRWIFTRGWWGSVVSVGGTGPWYEMDGLWIPDISGGLRSIRHWVMFDQVEDGDMAGAGGPFALVCCHVDSPAYRRVWTGAWDRRGKGSVDDSGMDIAEYIARWREHDGSAGILQSVQRLVLKQSIGPAPDVHAWDVVQLNNWLRRGSRRTARPRCQRRDGA